MTTKQTAGEWRAGIEARVAALEAWQKAQQTQPEPTVYYGANMGGWVTAGETAPNAYARITAGFGKVPIVRWWLNLFPASWKTPDYMTGYTALCPDFGSDVAGVLSGSYDVAWRNLCATATVPVMASFCHEPGNKGCTVTNWQAAQVRLAGIKADVANPLVTFGPVLMGGDFSATRYKNADGAPADAWLDFDMTNIDWIGGDFYQWPNDTAESNVGLGLAAAQSRGKRFLVAETGALPLSKVTDQARADWYSGILALVAANPGEFVAVLTFESDRGPANVPCCLLPTLDGTGNQSPLAAAVWRGACSG